jgi:hypothetical protein
MVLLVSFPAELRNEGRASFHMRYPDNLGHVLTNTRTANSGLHQAPEHPLTLQLREGGGSLAIDAGIIKSEN